MVWQWAWIKMNASIQHQNNVRTMPGQSLHPTLKGYCYPDLQPTFLYANMCTFLHSWADFHFDIKTMQCAIR